MSSVLGHYRRPGICVLTWVRDSADIALLNDFLAVTLPHVEQVAVGFMDVGLPAGLSDHPRVRMLRLCAAHHRQLAPGGPILHALCRIVEHATSLYLPITSRLQPEHFAVLRDWAHFGAVYPIAFRLPGELQEYATTYRQTLWRTGWNLCPDAAGGLVPQYGGQAPNMRVLDDLVAPPFQLAHHALITRLAGERVQGPIWIAGPPLSGSPALAGLCAQLGYKAYANPAGHPGVESSCQVFAANERLVADAGVPPTPWPWAEAVALWPGALAGNAAQQVAQAHSELARAGAAYSCADPLLAWTLPAWVEQTRSASCLVAVRAPSVLAAAWYQQLGIPLADGVRLWRDYYKMLLTHLHQLQVPSLFVDYDRACADAQQQYTRIAAAMGHVQGASAQAELAVQGADLSEIVSCLGEECLPGEAEDIAALYAFVARLCADASGAYQARAAQPTSTDAIALVARHTQGVDLAGWLDPIVALKQQGVVSSISVLVDSAAALPERLATQVSVVSCSEGLGRALSAVVEAASADVLLLTTTAITLTEAVVLGHQSSHRNLARPAVVIGSVQHAEDEQAQCVDVRLFGRIALPDLQTEPLPHDFPRNTSVARGLLDRVHGAAHAASEAWLWTELALHLHAHWVPVTQNAELRARSHALPYTNLDHARAQGEGMLALLSRWPEFIPSEALRRDVSARAPLLRELPSAEAELAQARSAPTYSSTPQVRRKVEREASQLVSFAAVDALVHTDPRIVRLLGRPLWTQVCTQEPERFGISRPKYQEAMAANLERCLALNGKHAGATAYICGTSPQLVQLSASQRRFLEHELVIGVNDAHYAVNCSYLLSAYYNRILAAHSRMPASATVIQMRPELSPPLVAGSLVVQRKLFEGDLSTRFDQTPCLRTFNNVVLGAVHLAVVMGARQLVFLGLEQKSALYFHSVDSGMRAQIAQHYRSLEDGRFFGLDHPYERHSRLLHELYGKDAAARAAHPNPYLKFDTRSTFRRYFDVLDKLGIGYLATTPDGVLTDAGAPYAPLPDALVA